MSHYDLHNKIMSPDATVLTIVEAAFGDLNSMAENAAEEHAFANRCSNLSDNDARAIDSLVDEFQDSVRNYIIDAVRGKQDLPIERTVAVRTLINVARGLIDETPADSEYVRGIAQVFTDALGNGGDSEHGNAFWTSQITAAEGAQITTVCPDLADTVYVLLWQVTDLKKIYGIDTEQPSFMGAHREGYEWYSGAHQAKATLEAAKMLSDNAGTRIYLKLVEVQVDTNSDDREIDNYISANRTQVDLGSRILLEMNGYAS